ncbi:carbohydrate kinase family protein [Streptomyces aculeolatus]
MSQVVVAGHICLDFAPRLSRYPRIRPGELVEVGEMAMSAGGCVANTGRTLSALGAEVRLTADTGDDRMSAALRRILEDEGMDPAGLASIPGATTSYSIVLQPPGDDRTFWHHVGANTHFDGSAVDVSGADIVHVGYPSVLPALLSGRAAPLCRLLERARNNQAMTSLDLAVVDPDSPAGGHDWNDLLQRVLPWVDVFSPSVDDLASALGFPPEHDPESLAAIAGTLLRYGAAVVAISAGDRGMVLATAGRARLDSGPLASLGPEWADRRIWMPSVPVGPAVPTTGAGDAATAGLLVGLVPEGSPEEALALAVRTASLHIGERLMSGGDEVPLDVSSARDVVSGQAG